jgi:hypothetical protein
MRLTGRPCAGITARLLLAFGLLLCGLAALPARAAESTPPDSLWTHMLATVAQSKEVLPGLLVTHFELRGGGDKVEKTGEQWIRLLPDSTGKPKSEIVKVIEDGKDVTEKVKASEAEKGSGSAAKVDSKDEGAEGNAESDGRHEASLSFKMGWSPFESDSLSRLEGTPNGRSLDLAGRTCVGYEFKREDKNQTIQGTAWIDPATGLPLEATFTSKPLPKHVKRMETTLRYEESGPPGWRLVGMTNEGEGGFLFIKKRFHMEMTLSEHWVAPLTRTTPAPPMP